MFSANNCAGGDAECFVLDCNSSNFVWNSFDFNTQQYRHEVYLYSIIYFFTIVDILLVTNLLITDGVFYIVTTLSSFAKLNHQFLGMLCFIKNLDAINQQYIHYCHAVFVSVIVIVIYLTAKCINRALLYIN